VRKQLGESKHPTAKEKEEARSILEEESANLLRRLAKDFAEH
jgi:hypothetical protein